MNPAQIPLNSAIKYINGGGPSASFGKQHRKATPAPAAQAPRATPVSCAVRAAPVSQATRAAPVSRAVRATSAAHDPERVLQAYEEGRSAFNELLEIHESATKRLERVEQDLRRERERCTGYESQIASQEQELRKLREGKRAVEELNSRLTAKLNETAGFARSAQQDSRHAMDSRNWKSEADKLTRKLRSYDEMMDYTNKVLGVCVQLCEPLSKETGKDILEAQQTMREFQESMRDSISG